MKAATLVLAALAFAGIGSTYIAHEPAAPEPLVVVQALNPLEKARQASFDLDMPMGAGSAVLVGRVKLEDGTYRYRALTAYHVIQELIQVEDPDPDPDLDSEVENEEPSRDCTATFQIEFHGPPLTIPIEVELDWTVPASDWASFTFVASEKIVCAEVATREDFKAIQAWDSIYIVASYGPYGPQCRQGVIATTHNVGIYVKAQQTSPSPWNQNPNDFFRFSMPIWYGDSGGPIFNEFGRLIGLGNAFTVSRGGGFGPPQQVTHSGVAIKVHLIKEAVDAVTKDFFKIEE